MRSTYRRQTFPRHTHEYFTLGVMLHGVGTLWYRGANFTLHPPEVVLIPPGEVHTGGMGSQSDVLSYLAVHLPAEAVAVRARVNDLRDAGVPDFVSPVIRDPDVSAALQHLDRAIRRVAGTTANPDSGHRPAPSPADELAANRALTTAIDLLLLRHTASVPRAEPLAGNEPTLVQVVREIIEDCYADRRQTSLQALAQRIGVTPFHLVRVFTQSTGLSPHRFVVQTRIRRAREFLAGGIPSSFVAAMTGFVDQSHLTTQFKRYVGTTPASYQRCLFAGTSRPAATRLR
jgi:AraC-like DNA-binding protein